MRVKSRGRHLLGIGVPRKIAANALPCTPSAYIMARLLGGDHHVAARIISVQTALAVATMPLILVLTAQ
ncbi:hypothetical protein [Bradyrhizobium sp. SRS-191]|uniref:hypothetical protein n=1 Tax=Bradyrhizobium sp. SRS-191 TaxID=2962606 RepID=UPI00211E9EFC|nr:hypothetical protein [Bradyrhizobium sp. SRS-191]